MKNQISSRGYRFGQFRNSPVTPGFTLVELLVVIGIISVLISILLPTMTRARQSAQTVKCLANLRQIGIAIRMYANDNKDYMIPAETFSDAGRLTQYTCWHSILMSEKYLPAQSKIGGLYNPSNSVLICPSSVDLKGGQLPVPASQEDSLGARYFGINASGYAPATTSYGINAWQDVQYFSFSPFNDYPMSNSFSLSLPVTQLHKFNQVRDAANLVTIFDGIWMLNGSTTRINARHDGRQKTNLLFVDGHAATATTKSMPHDGGPSFDLYSAVSCSKTSDGAKWRLDQ